jgi:hypothetical protein
MLSDKERDMARYLAEVHNLANKGIKGRGKGRKVKRVSLLHPPPKPPQQQQQLFPSTSPIGTTLYAARYPMSLLAQASPYHHDNTAPRLPPTAHFSSGFGNPAACTMNRSSAAMPFSYGGLPPSLNTPDTTYAYHPSDAYAD